MTESPDNAVTGFSIDAATGQLTALKQGRVNTGTTPVRVAGDPAGKFLYVANQASKNVSAYSIASDGTLSALPGSPFALTDKGIDIAVAPSGKFVFVAQGSTGGSVAVFSIGSNGALSQVAGSPFALHHVPNAVITDPSGKYLYVATGPVEAFSIDQNSGALTPVPGEPFQVTGPPNCPTCAGTTIAFNLAVDPTGAHLYTADSFAGSVFAFDIDSSTGTLSTVPGAPFVDRMPTGQPMDPAFNPYGIAIGAQGKFLYGYNSGDEDIATFPINTATGALGTVQISVNTFGGACAGQLLRIDSTGKFMYGLGATGPNCNGFPGVIGYAINQTSGTLTPIPPPDGVTLAIDTVPFNDGLALVP